MKFLLVRCKVIVDIALRRYSRCLQPYIILETIEGCVVRLNEEEPRKAVQTAVRLLKSGKLLALPTDTVYGFAASANNRDACQELYHVKGRENAKPLAICVGKVEDVYKWGKVPISNQLLNLLLPGPVTILLEPKEDQRLPLPEDPKLVGIRVPNHDFPRAVANSLGIPIALTSANISGEPSSLDPQEFKSLWSKLSTVFDGGVIADEVRDMLIAGLGESVKEVQLEASQLGLSTPLGSCDATSSLCVGLEAIFLHGLRSSLASRLAKAFSDADPPQPAFWNPLMIFSHRDAIQQVNTLSQINTDVGKCRAWLRIALSEGLLSSYFGSIRRQNSAVTSYYHRTALLRDSERLEVVQRMLIGLEPVKLELASNSSLLNVWPSSTLMLAGLWAPPLRACPVAPALDVALSLSDDAVVLEVEESPIMPIPRRTAAPIDEDEAFKIILRQPESDFVQQANSSPNTGTVSPINADNTEVPINADNPSRSSDAEETVSSQGNSLARGGWSSASFDDEDGGEVSSTPEAQSSHQSYDALLESYNLLAGGYVRTPDLRDFLKKFSDSIIHRDATPVTTATDSMSSSIYGMGFEVVPKSPTCLSDIPEYHIMLLQLGKLPREPGLDSQNYSCLECSTPIGVNFGKAKVCGLTGNYYCTECYVGEEWTIPSRVLLNWDFRKYGVSRKAAMFLTEIQSQALLDVSKINIALYSCCEDMAHLQSLRIQLNLLRAYLFSCREPVIVELQRKVWPHEYLYEHVHLYSISDLQQIPNGTLAHKLSRVVDFARKHVLSCWLCSQKGFICEICNNPQVIYPFETDATYRCHGCNAVFHIGCLNAKLPCPKCERRKRREEEERSNIHE